MNVNISHILPKTRF